MKNKKIIYIGLFFIIIVGIASSIHTIQNKPENIIKKFLKKWQVILIFTHIIIIFSVNFRRLIKIVFKSARKFTCVLIP